MEIWYVQEACCTCWATISCNQRFGYPQKYCCKYFVSRPRLIWPRKKGTSDRIKIYRDIGQLINIANPEQNINFLRSCHEGLSPKRRLSFAWGFQGLSEQYPKNYPRSWTRKLLILTVDLSIVSPWMTDPWQIDPCNWGPYNSYGVHNWDSSQYW